ncbi:MAG: hypothetical protein K8F36_14650 [Melioribacteraceae bacterium]|nr:hypothetical protein [Melioribacteraceae bacterium]
MSNLKFFITFLLVAVFLFSCGSDKTQKDKSKDFIYFEEVFLPQEDREELKAGDLGIKKRNVISFFYTKTGQLADKGFLVETREYTKNGKLDYVERYTSKGNIDLKWTYDYNGEDHLIHKEAQTGAGFIRYKGDYTYDSDGDVIKRIELNIKNGEYETSEIEYAGAGAPKLIEKHNSNGDLIETTNLEYDEQGRLISLEHKNGKGNLFRFVEYEYDSLNRVIKEISVDAMKIKKEIFYEYDENGYVSLKDAGHFKQVFTNDSKGNIIQEEVLDGEDYLQQRYEYVYDNKGLLIERLRYDGMGNAAFYTKYEYEFH